MSNQTPCTVHAEEPSSSNIVHIEEQIEEKMATGGSRTTTRTCHSMDTISVDQCHEVREKPHCGVSPKGFKELLKFRRKGQSSASGELNADSSAFGVCTAANNGNVLTP